MSNKDLNLRNVQPIKTDGINAFNVSSKPPIMKWVDPKMLYVEAEYQRDVAARSVTLIRRIVRNFDWRKLKPPICAEVAKDKYVIIDGQHTAIAAASHPNIQQITIMIVDAGEMQQRAQAFMGHNRDRVALTQQQLFYAAMAAGDEAANATAEACRLAKVVIRKTPPAKGVFKTGETMAIGAINSMVARKGAGDAARVLKVLVAAGRAPVVATEIKAVAEILFHPSRYGPVSIEAITKVVASKSAMEWELAAGAEAAAAGVSRWRALVDLWAEIVAEKTSNDDAVRFLRDEGDTVTPDGQGFIVNGRRYQHDDFVKYANVKRKAAGKPLFKAAA